MKSKIKQVKVSTPILARTICPLCKTFLMYFHEVWDYLDQIPDRKISFNLHRYFYNYNNRIYPKVKKTITFM